MDIAIQIQRRNGRVNRFVSIAGGDKPTIAQIAQRVCVEAAEVLEDIANLRDNDPITDYLWRTYGKAYFEQFEKDASKSDSFRVAFFWANRGTGDEVPGEVKKPSEYVDKRLERFGSALLLAARLGADYTSWKVDLSETGPLLLTTELDQTRWDTCRISNSEASRKTEKVEAYRKAVKALNPYLDKMESLIRSYEETMRAWQESKEGADFLQGIAMLNLVERITGVYSNTNPDTRPLNAQAMALLEQCGEYLQEAMVKAAARPLRQMSKLYFDADFGKATFNYLKLWDATDHYYFHTQVANSVNAPTKMEGKSNSFDDRFFRAVTEFIQYLSADPATADQVAREATEVAKKLGPKITELAEKGKLDSRNRLETLLTAAERFYGDVQASAPTGLVTVFGVWSGYITSWVGNIEGPPTVLSLILVSFAKNERFVRTVTDDTLLEWFVMIGVDKIENRHIVELIKSNRVEDARSIFVNSSWRSNRIYAAFTLMGLAILVYHADAVYAKWTKDEDLSLDSEFVKLLLPVIQDIANLGLTGLTIAYSRDLSAFLQENIAVTSRVLQHRMMLMEQFGFRVFASRWLFRAVAFIGVVINVWDTASTWTKSDHFEKFVKVATVGASLALFLGSIGVTSWLGPVGFVIGVILGIVLVAYQSWFKRGIEKTLLGLLTGFENTLLYKLNKERVVGARKWFVAFTYVIELETLEDELSQNIANTTWRTPALVSAIHYYRAGIAPDSLLVIFELDEDRRLELIRELEHDRFRLEQQEKRDAVMRIVLTAPGAGVELHVGTLSLVTVTVFNYDSSSDVWMEADPQWYSGDPDRYLAEGEWAPGELGLEKRNAYDPRRQALILRNSQNFGDALVFSGYLRLFEVPPGGVAKFYVKVPKQGVRYTNGVPDDWQALKLVEIPVER